MYQLFYVSNATAPMTKEKLRVMLVAARQKNSSLDVTGMLLYRHGIFAQVLEGTKLVVRDLYGQILQDPRHQKVTTMFEGPATTREFPAWSMAFRDISLASTTLEGFSGFLNHASGSKETFFPAPPASRHLLEVFRRVLTETPEDL